MAARKKAGGKARNRKPAERSSRGSRKGTAHSKGRRAKHKAAGTKTAGAPRRVKSPTRAVTSTLTSQGAPAKDRAQLIFEALTDILVPYMNQFEADMHPCLGYCLRVYGAGSDEMHFAGVQWSSEKLYFHLFPLQRHLDLRAQIGPDLRARLEGDWSFGFERIEPE